MDQNVVVQANLAVLEGGRGQMPLRCASGRRRVGSGTGGSVLELWLQVMRLFCIVRGDSHRSRIRYISEKIREF